MKIYVGFLAITFAFTLNAEVLISPINAMKSVYGEKSEISKKNILLSSKQAAAITKEAKVALDTKIFRVFKAVEGSNILGYGVLVSKKVRSKNAVILYMISHNSTLKSIEIIAFNEPLEYLPSTTWNSQFENVETSKMLRLSKDIPTITGATLSARSVTDGSRVAFAFYNEVLKEK